MNSTVYSELVVGKFPEWICSSKYLVQDFEKCLRTEESRIAIRRAGLELVENYPK